MTAGPAAAGTVRTVLGDVPMERLGRCGYHEHLFEISPLLVGDELDDEQASSQQAESLRRADHRGQSPHSLGAAIAAPRRRRCRRLDALLVPARR
jgi:predicted metal-dependent phosphotriesterase family hydrolase